MKGFNVSIRHVALAIAAVMLLVMGSTMYKEMVATSSPRAPWDADRIKAELKESANLLASARALAIGTTPCPAATNVMMAPPPPADSTPLPSTETPTSQKAKNKVINEDGVYQTVATLPLLEVMMHLFFYAMFFFVP